MNPIRNIALAALALLFLAAPHNQAHAQRQYGGQYTAQALANARANASGTAWGQTQKNAAINAAAKWVNLSDDQLWRMIPGQALPRCINVTWDYNYPSNPQLGCLNCGDAIHSYGSGYPYNPDIFNKKWKLTCPHCNIVFPTNDFGAFYESGINSKGVFDPAIADRSLLFNTAHPDPSDPLHKYGVDDGLGFLDPATGRYHKYIGYYGWKYWREIWAGVRALGNAYVLTGDKVYARKAAIMLDRIADVYPAMDWAPYANRGWYHSDGGSKKGKIEGRIWETQVVQYFATAYDMIISGTVDNPQLYTFLQQKDQEYDLPGVKGTRAALIANIDSGILETAANAITVTQQVRGNEGMHQYSMALTALALNTEPKTSQWLDWLFEPGTNKGHLPTMLVQLFDRDGMANEAAPHYNYLWPNKIHEIMKLLERYPTYTNQVISRDYPWFRNASRAPWQVQLLNTFTPNIGDTGAVGLLDQPFSPHMIADGFEYFNDHTSARYAWEANGNKATNLLLDITSPTPDAWNQKLAQAALNYPVTPRYGENLAGYGLASFEFGNDRNGKALWMYYGRNTGHGHQDRLNFSIYAFKTDLSPDMGYPEFASGTWAPRAAWNNNTISHNTVVVDKARQATNWTGYPRFYTTGPGFGAVEVESRNVYSQTSEYARTMAFIQAPQENAYAVDIFRVTGGSDHLLSFHGPPGTVAASGLFLTRQQTGTYAGPDIPYGSTSGPSGYSYLKNVDRDNNPPPKFTLDWKAQTGYRGVTAADNLHLRLHMLTQLNDVALADGVPAQNKPGNPATLRYALMHRAGSPGLDTQFVSIIEPWKNQSFVLGTTRLPVSFVYAPEVVALRVDLTGGISDYIISNPQRKNIGTSGGPSTDGAFAWVRTVNGAVTSASLTQGSNLSFNGVQLEGPGNIAGRIVQVLSTDAKSTATAILDVTQGDPYSMVGSQIIFNNDRVRNACYDVLSIEPYGNRWRITCGPASFVRGFVDTNDYTKGYVLNVAADNTFYSPVTTTLQPPQSAVATWGLY